MNNELRYYLDLIKHSIAPHTGDEGAEALQRDVFVPKYIVTAVQLPTGAVELAVNNDKILEKIDYILEAYDQDMRLKTNPDVVMKNIMVV